MQRDRTYTPAEAARYLGLSLPAIYAALHAGRLTAADVRPLGGGAFRRTYRFRSADLDAYRERMARRRANAAQRRLQRAAPRPPAQPGLALPYLRAWRLARGLSAGDLAYHARITSSWVYELESGRQRTSRVIVERLAHALHIRPATLVERAPAANPSPTAAPSAADLAPHTEAAIMAAS